LKGIRHPKALPQYDQGRVDPSLELSYVTLLLKPSPDQQASLDRLLADQQDPSSPSHHKWLTPEQFADRFGASSTDIAKIVAWLESQGLTVNDVARGRHWISFTGKADQIDRAFRTEIHRYTLDGETHYANASEPSIPAALANVVGGFAGLDDFVMQPRSNRKKLLPEYNLGRQHLLAPDDLATIYNITPLYTAGIDGSGQKIVIVGATGIDLGDIQAFRALFKLPPSDPQLVLVGSDPGTSPGALAEADLDIEWSGAVARNATIVYVYGRSINAAIQYAVDQNLAPVISISFGNCEQNLAPALRSVAQQGNAQGITLIAASGDSGAAACDAPFSRPQATQGMAVSFPASMPEVTAVGGAQFNEGGDTYWSGANTDSSASALSYIPEIAWNETAATGLASSGGGASILYPKPAWQSGPGVPSDNARDVPDVVLSAAGHDGYFGISQASNFIFSGTSAAAPAFAGIVALLNQYAVSTGAQAQPGLGNINPALYRLAQTSPNAFHDITSGDNMVPCWQASSGCSAGAFGYQAATGYDLATGLGSVDAYNLITQWNTQSTGTTIELTANPSSVTLNSAMQLTAAVSAPSGGPISGSVSFNLGNTALGSVPLTGGSATLTVYGSVLPIGPGTITAIYSGDGQHSGSSATIAITVGAPAANSAVIPSITPNPVFAFENLSGANRLTSWTYSVRLKEVAGVPTTLTDYTINGVSFASQIVSYFGKAAIAANGTLSAGNLTLTNLTAPETVVFGFSGVDADGQKWSQQLSVPFYGAPPTEDYYVFSERPTTVVQDPNADHSCQWSQQLNVQELYGVPHRLTRLVAGGVDISNRIQQIFGTTQVAPFGGLYGKLCWTGITPPQTSNLQLDDVTLSASFRGPAASPIPITVSPAQVTLSVADSSQTATASVAIDFAGSLKQAWTINKFPLNVTNNWLTISTTSGTGPAQLNLQASAAGMANGVYTATVIVTAPNSAPGYANVTVVFVVGASPTTGITGAANAASRAGAFAPGMLMTVSGSQLAPATVQARTFPLALSMAGVSATVNGVNAPVTAVAPDQLTIQIPYETGAGPAVLGVNNNGQVAAYSFQVAPSAPGIFTDQNSGLLPVASGRPGQTLVMSITGDGDTSPALANGSTPPLGTSQSRLPSPRLPVTMTIGGIPAQIISASIPNGFVGKTQISFKVPLDAAPGVQPVVVTVGGIDSPPANLTVTP
jgi:uncharacterized protein (TIGR03437 family)